jgi:bifunctional UDP-N-acetylglucosamine pyrophosphorylase/glucosamine-1-phosphate N-acetyltransferase
MIRIEELFDLVRVPAPLRDLLEVEWPWEVLARLDAFGDGLVPAVRGRVHPTAVLDGVVVVEEGAEIGPFVAVQGPVYLAAGARVLHGAFLRGPVVLGPDARVGHATEVKRSLLLGGARAPHFNYVGDSVLGHDVNLGAGVKLANVKTVGGSVMVGDRDSRLRKLGSALGDGVSIGCNAVLAPGTVVGRGTVIYNGAMVRGVVPAGRILKLRQRHEVVTLD